MAGKDKFKHAAPLNTQATCLLYNNKNKDVDKTAQYH